ncbi:putative pectinesterase/pectinesterase inhibitor 7 [Apium graveolens]|uniref:putative pectinesterase/pectinesterase inhibitor 7 n=1 Tax=Apium graveolens TaxID=4045 RepID=UPI003D792FCB
MACKPFISSSFSSALFIFLLSLLFSSAALAADICDSTPYPSSCRSSAPNNNNATANVYDYGRSSFTNSLSTARSFLSSTQNFLQRSSDLTTGAIAALEDCRLLADLNIDYISESSKLINQPQTLSTSEIDNVHTLMSSVLTNTQTCLDGLEEAASSWSSKDGVLIPLVNATKLYSVSLSLFKRGWVPKTRSVSVSHTPRKRGAFVNGRFPFKMVGQNKASVEKIGGRKLLQDGGGEYIVVSAIVVVSQDGTGDFLTINEALTLAPNKTAASDGYFVIYVTAGVYEEYVSIPKNNRYVMMIGDGINQTVITGNRSTTDGFTTFNTATFAVVGPGFVAVNITFRNTAGGENHQAVAMRSGADMSTFYSCSFEGYQDTLYPHSNRQFYTECDIYGTVDFIFGNGAAVLQDCNIYPRLPLSNQFNAITAQGRSDINQNTGISIQNCNIRAADDLASSSGGTQTYLGRPWKLYSRTIYMQSFMDSLINPVGWREWSGTFALDTLYYAEFSNTGPGSDTSGRVTWTGYRNINETDAAAFTVSSFISGDNWLPLTGVPYSSGL